MKNVDVTADLSGNVWKILVAVGDPVSEDDPIMILESMKMEIPVLAPASGSIESLHVDEGDAVQERQLLAVVACVT